MNFLIKTLTKVLTTLSYWCIILTVERKRLTKKPNRFNLEQVKSSEEEKRI